MKIRQSKFTHTQGKGLASSPKTPWKGGREGRTDRQTHSKSCPAYAGFQILIEKITEHFFFHYETKQTTDITFLIDRREGLFSPCPLPFQMGDKQRNVATDCQNGVGRWTACYAYLMIPACFADILILFPISAQLFGQRQ